MEKSVQRSSRFKLQKVKRVKKYRFLDCLINMLPDEILVSILSLLTMKEAARTSILSYRWRYLWTFTSILSFDDSQLVIEMLWGLSPKTVNVERPRFVDWVNKVLRLHKGRTLDEFSVCFDVDERSNKYDLDGWFKFAFERRAKKIEFDLTYCYGYFSFGNYTVTTQFLLNFNLNHLTVLRLNCVDLTVEVLEHLLSSCPLLEVLSVTNAKCLLHVKVSGPSLKLKCLEILLCRSLKSIEISARNLTSFKYQGPMLSIFLKEVPCLVEAYFMGPYSCFLVRHIPQHSPCLSQLQKLVLEITLEKFHKIPRFPKLRNLKQLELVLDRYRVCSLLQWMSILKACPMLHKFSQKVVGPAAASKLKAKVVRGKRLHQCLKVFKISGFVDSKIDIELVQYVLLNTLALEKIIIDTRLLHPSAKGGLDVQVPDVKLAARNRAQRLKIKFPPGAELVIL